MKGWLKSVSIADNLTLSRLQPYSRWGWLSLRRREEAVGHWMKPVGSQSQPGPSNWSRNCRAAISRRSRSPGYCTKGPTCCSWTSRTRGIDVGTKAEIYRRMGELAASGKSVIFVSSYLPELLAVCDRVGVMSRGRLRESSHRPNRGTRKR